MKSNTKIFVIMSAIVHSKRKWLMMISSVAIITLFLSSLPFLMINVASYQPTNVVTNPVQSVNSGCLNGVPSIISQTEASTLGKQQAITTAEYSSQYRTSIDTNYPVSNQTFNSVFYLWKSNSDNCTPSLESVNVAFTVRSGANAVAVLVVSLDPTESKILNVSTQPAIYHPPPAVVHTQNYWSGYQFVMYDNQGHSQYIGQVTGNFGVPYTDTPPTGGCGWPPGCDLSIWVGFSTSYGGGGGLVQTGTDSYVDCFYFICNKGNNVWYEDYPNNPSVNCFGVSPGDAIQSTVWITVSNGQYIPNAWTVDNTKGQQCSTSYGSESTYYSQFIYETPLVGGTFATLPKFWPTANEETGFDGNIWASDSCCIQAAGGNPGTPINVPYQNGWYYTSTMTNGGVLNIQLSGVSYDPYANAGYFSETWLSSKNT